ncbi:ATP-grasp domain-containing protein [Glaciecola sp. 2405UD65-10]|uniref:ATP-grasp domain-containing protein n=1 Tax=Glaciecola sp. 2405UD65-10 TaxID=3397244 RepID=UPI003B5B7C62
MLRCAFLTTNNLEDFFIYDDLVKPHLEALGWQVVDVPWREKDHDYNQYDVVVVRSTWDYQEHPEAFINTLTQIEKSTARLENAYELMVWNFSKDYLRDLEVAGVAILPTIWLDAFNEEVISGAFSYFTSGEIIIKPRVSANADSTYRLTHDAWMKNREAIAEDLKQRPLMIQKFEQTILEQGEFSLFYFAHKYSHTINKRPEKGDFRVQEEHGGSLAKVDPSYDMLELAEKTLESLPQSALYARIDMLQTDLGLAIIEVELIEPSLYFNMDEPSAKRFAIALNERFKVT